MSDRGAFGERKAVRVPGMADELLDELRPYLLEDGVDLRTASFDDLDVLNSALGRAVERRNATLFHPNAAQRSYALTVFRLVTEALHERQRELAQAIVWGIAPEPEGDEHASVAHVIAVGLELIDAWVADDATRDSVFALRLAPWSKGAHAAVNGILEAADDGERATAQVGRLIATHGGLALLEGVAIAVSGVVHADARRRKRAISESISALLVDPDA